MKTIHNIAVVLGVTLLVIAGCSKDGFKEAKAINTADAYREFLQKSPDGKHSAKAYDAYVDAIAREGITYFGEGTSLDRVKEVFQSRKLGKGEEVLSMIQYLKQVVESQGMDERFTIESISAVPEMPAVESADRYSKAVTGFLTSPFDNEAERKIEGYSVVKNGDSQYWLVSTDEPFAIESIGAWLGGVASNVTIRAGDNRTEMLRELPNEQVLFGFKWMGTVQPVIPAAKGSVIRLSGNIDDLAIGWTFSGDTEDPLTFMFAAEGLTYLGGTGRIIDPTGKEYLLPDVVTALRPGMSGVKISGPAERPSANRCLLHPGVMSVDNEKILLWLRDIETSKTIAPVFTLDLKRTKDVDGRTWIAVDQGVNALHKSDDIMFINDEAWIWSQSLKCEDAWERFWDIHNKRSWYLQVSDVMIINKRLHKEKGKEFSRDFWNDSWVGPDVKKREVGDQAEIRLSDDKKNFVFVGNLAFSLGELRQPIGGLLAALIKDNPRTTFLKGGIPLEEDTIEQLVSFGKVVKANVDSMTVNDFLIELKKYPKACALLADRLKNYVQSIAEVIDPEAGQKVMAFGFNRSEGDRLKTIGSEYTFDLTEFTAYPISNELAVWSGGLKIVPDADARPMIWCIDGTHFVLDLSRRTILEDKAVGTIQYAFCGTYEDGYPKHIASIRRKGVHKDGPIAKEDLYFHAQTSVRAVPYNERLMFTAFGENVVIQRPNETQSSTTQPTVQTEETKEM